MEEQAGSSSAACTQPPALNAYALQLQVLDDYRAFAATTIQRFYRGWAVRARRARQVRTAAGAHAAVLARLAVCCHYTHHAPCLRPAMRLQAAAQQAADAARARASAEAERRYWAARTIQDGWRRTRNRPVYEHLRQLIRMW